MAEGAPVFFQYPIMFLLSYLNFTPYSVLCTRPHTVKELAAVLVPVLGVVKKSVPFFPICFIFIYIYMFFHSGGGNNLGLLFFFSLSTATSYLSSTPNSFSLIPQKNFLARSLQCWIGGTTLEFFGGD